MSTLQKTLASVLDDPLSRVIVVSNGSRPASARQLDAFAAENSERVRVVSFEKNLGSSQAFAAGLVAAWMLAMIRSEASRRFSTSRRT